MATISKHRGAPTRRPTQAQALAEVWQKEKASEETMTMRRAAPFDALEIVFSPRTPQGAVCPSQTILGALVTVSLQQIKVKRR
jgi:hypothetical protein